MIREHTFVMSHRPYAVKLDTFNLRANAISHGGVVTGTYWSWTMQAVWFRRKDGRVTAHTGHLWDTSHDDDRTVWTEALARWDGRYGGSCIARWDGATLWTAELPFDREQAAQGFLSMVLDNFPAVPDGYDGWWTNR